MSGHSKTPWRLEEEDGDYTVYPAAGGIGDFIMNDTAYYPTCPSVEDMKFIVKAVNAHEALVEALEEVLASFKHGDDSGSALYIDDDYGELAEMIATALALAKGGE